MSANVQPPAQQPLEGDLRFLNQLLKYTKDLERRISLLEKNQVKAH